MILRTYRPSQPRRYMTEKFLQNVSVLTPRNGYDIDLVPLDDPQYVDELDQF